MQAPCCEELRDELDSGQDGSKNAEEIGPCLKVVWGAKEDHIANDKKKNRMCDTDGCDEERGTVSWRRGGRQGVRRFKGGGTGEKEEEQK